MTRLVTLILNMIFDPRYQPYTFVLIALAFAVILGLFWNVT